MMHKAWLQPPAEYQRYSESVSENFLKLLHIWAKQIVDKLFYEAFVDLNLSLAFSLSVTLSVVLVLFLTHPVFLSSLSLSYLQCWKAGAALVPFILQLYPLNYFSFKQIASSHTTNSKPVSWSPETRVNGYYSMQKYPIFIRTALSNNTLSLSLMDCTNAQIEPGKESECVMNFDNDTSFLFVLRRNR